MQITRIFFAKDPNVDIIYVSPFELSTEIMNYYVKVNKILRNLKDFGIRRNTRNKKSITFCLACKYI